MSVVCSAELANWTIKSLLFVRHHVTLSHYLGCRRPWTTLSARFDIHDFSA